MGEPAEREPTLNSLLDGRLAGEGLVLASVLGVDLCPRVLVPGRQQRAIRR